MTNERLVHELALRGGAARRGQLPVSRGELERALSAGIVRRRGRGLYALQAVDEGLVLARAMSGARSHRTAALAHGFAVAEHPLLPDVVVMPGRNLPGELRRRAHVRWRALSRAEREAGTTGPLNTVVSCLRDLSRVEGLAVADSAVRSGMVTVEEIAAALASDRGPGVRAARLTVPLIDPGAASAMETVLRYVASEVDGLALRTQVSIQGPGWGARVDLADPELGIVAEADSFEWHGSRAALARDARRYDHLVSAGWRVLRFSYEAIFGEQEWVAARLAEAVATQTRLAHAGLTDWKRSLTWSRGETHAA